MPKILVFMQFLLKIKSHLLCELNIISPDQCFVVKTNDTQLVNNFLCWMEGKKHFPGDKIDFSLGEKHFTDMLMLKKHLKILRFQLAISEKNGVYYQQRYHATENDDLITLRGFLGEISNPYYKKICSSLGLLKLLDEKINILSTGEFRKALTLKTILSNPKIIFVEEPYVGIDSNSRDLLNSIFEYLTSNGTSVIIFTSTQAKPKNIHQILDIGEQVSDFDIRETEKIKIPHLYNDARYTYTFELNNIVARYNNHKVLHDINWKAERNQKWALTGKNGAGKSTLLSFVNADNPQVYCNEVYLFGKKRGVGQSIWDVKECIGFYSPELNRYFNKLQTVESAINSLIFQNPYKKRILHDDELLFKQQLLKYFGLEGMKSKMLYELSMVMQRLVLLTGILAKNTPLLILDEPFQGFSDDLVQKTKAVIEKFSHNKTLVMVSHNNQNFPGCITRNFHLLKGKGQEISMEQIIRKCCKL